MMRVLVIFLLGIHLTAAATHTLQYFYTGSSGIANFPKFMTAGLVDGQQIDYYDSDIRKAVQKAEWISGAVDPDYWNRNTQIYAGNEPVYENGIEILKSRFNQTGGVHSWQMMCGCELNDDGTKRGYLQYGYDGEDFVSFDKNTLTWTAANPQAVITKHKWEATEAQANYWKGYLENTCIEWLQKYVRYGKDTLERKVSPQVSLLQKDPSSSVSCHATGFFPSGVTITWMKNGQDHIEDVDLGQLIPNEDGTFQVMSTITVTPEEWKNNKYSCVVEHQGETISSILTEDKIKTNYDSSASVPIFIILAAVAGVLLLIVTVVAGYKVYQKKKGFKPVNASDDGSNSSAHSDPKA